MSETCTTVGAALAGLPRVLLDHLQQAVWLASADGNDLYYLNPACQRLLHYADWHLQPTASQPWWQAWVRPSDWGVIRAALQQCQLGKDQTLSLQLPTKDSLNLVELVLMQESAGQCVGFVYPMTSGVPRTWSDQEMFRGLLDSLPLALVVKNLQGQRVFTNRFYLELHGFAPGQVLGKTDDEIFPAEIAQQFVRDDQRVLQSREILHSVERLPLRDQKYCWIERIKSPAYDSHGQLIGVQLLFWDITKRFEIEKLLEEERALLHALLNNMPDAIYFKDRASRFRRVSVGLARKFGIADPKVAIGKSDADFTSAEQAARIRKDELRIIETGQPIINRVERETWSEDPDTWCSTTKLPLRDGSGQIVGTFGMSRDITAQKRIEQQLREARDAANAANFAKSEFLANMSHEIRTPLNGILGMTQLLAQTPLNERQRDYVELVHQSGESLLELLNDILDFSKIEAGRMRLETIAFSISETIAAAVQVLGVRADGRGLDLAIRIDPDLPDKLFGDPTRLRQVVVNLVGNAIKFTEQGEVVVDVQRVGSTSQASDLPDSLATLKDLVWVEVSVRDTGIGISPDEVQQIFDAFTQADASTSRRFGGTGLGLTISAKLVQLMGGQLRVESAVGQGTTFRFCLPLGVGQPESMQGDVRFPLEQFPSNRVLVVDEDCTNRHVLIELLKHWRFKPFAAGTQEQALNAIRVQQTTGTHFAFVILNWMMDDIDGQSLIERLRSVEQAKALPIIVMNTVTHGMESELSRRLGIDQHLLRPFIPRELWGVIARLCQPQSAADLPSTSEMAAPTARPLRILLVEDGFVNQRFATEWLQLLGHDVTLAQDGSEAVAIWMPDSFDLVLMDLQMPKLDGFEATAAIRRAEIGTDVHTPIVAMTARAMQHDRQLCLDAGMDDFISKPIDPQRLQTVLARFSSQHESSRSSSKVSPSDGTADVASAAAGPGISEFDSSAATTPQRTEPSPDLGGALTPGRNFPPSEPSVLDIQPLLDRFDGRASILLQLADAFLDEAPELLRQMQGALRSGNCGDLRRAAHTLKGNCELFKAEQLRCMCAELESRAFTGDGRDLEGMVRAIDATYTNVASALRQCMPPGN